MEENKSSLYSFFVGNKWTRPENIAMFKMRLPQTPGQTCTTVGKMWDEESWRKCSNTNEKIEDHLRHVAPQVAFRLSVCFSSKFGWRIEFPK